MNKQLEFSKLLRDIVYSTSLSELKDNVVKVNEFVSKNYLSSDSEEYKKLENAIKLMKLKLRKTRKKNDDDIY
jgi:hypothetical protein